MWGSNRNSPTLAWCSWRGPAYATHKAPPNVKAFENPCFHTRSTACATLRKHSFLFPAVPVFCPHQYLSTWRLFRSPGLSEIRSLVYRPSFPGIQTQVWNMAVCSREGRIKKSTNEPSSLPDCAPPRVLSQSPSSIFYIFILLWKANVQFQLAGYGSRGLLKGRWPRKAAAACIMGNQGVLL